MGMRVVSPSSVRTKKGVLGMKSISAFWALLVGLLSVIAQVITYTLRFERLNTESPFADYFFFFLAGTVGGFILIFFLNRQPTRKGRWIVLIVFLLIAPVSLFLMLGGGLFGPLGLLLLPQIPWLLFTWLGSLLGRFVSRKM
jgi:uncharacterized membrane protein